MRLGLFMNFEHGEEDNLAAFKRQTDLAVKAEALGLDELWVSEHHFSTFTQSGSVLPLMACLAGRTSRIRIGSAAILMPLHDPIRVAEDLATIDILSQGRLNLGLARGGPFPAQFKHFGVALEEARDQAREATEFLLRLLSEREVTFKGRWYQAEDLTTLPRLVQHPLPVWIASATQETVADAGRRGFGLMAGHAWPGEMISGLLDTYKVAAKRTYPDLVVLRNVCVADTDAAALKAAIPALERFFGRMREHSNPGGPSSSPVSLENVLPTAIIGSPETCCRKLAELASKVPVSSLVMKIACLDPSLAVETVRRFREEIVAVDKPV